MEQYDSPILDEASKVEFLKEEIEKEMTKEKELEDFNFLIVLDAFDISKEELTPEKIERVREIYDWAILKGEPLEVLREMDFMLNFDRIYLQIKIDKESNRLGYEEAKINYQKEVLNRIKENVENSNNIR